MKEQFIESYETALHNLWHQNTLKDELYTENPTHLRSTALQSIYKRIKHYEELVKSYELVAEDLEIDIEDLS